MPGYAPVRQLIDGNIGAKRKGENMLFKNIPQGHCMIVERFRKPSRVCGSGLHFFIPLLDKAKNVRDGRFSCGWGDNTNKNGIFIELAEQITRAVRIKKKVSAGLVKKSPPQVSDAEESAAVKPVVSESAKCAVGDGSKKLDGTRTDFEQFYTMDNVKVVVDSFFRWRIVDPVAAVYEVDKLHEALTKVVLASLRSFIGSHDLNFILASRQQLSEAVVTQTSDSVKKWGVSITGVDIRKLELDEGTKDAMRQQIEASRECEARKLLARGEADAVKTKAEGSAAALERQAEAERNSTILRAEGQAEAVRLRAEGEKKYLAMLVESLGSEAAAEILVAEKTFGSFATIAAGKSSKVYLETPKMPTVESLDGKISVG